jgi:hypothetical protein
MFNPYDGKFWSEVVLSVPEPENKTPLGCCDIVNLSGISIVFIINTNNL